MSKSLLANKLSARLLPIAGALILVGCSTLAPDYSRSELAEEKALDESLQLQYQAEQYSGVSSQQANQVPWQSFIQDSRLTQVIELALNNNRSLRQTLADVEAARATYGIQKAELYPNINLGLGGSRSKTSSGNISTVYTADASLSGYEIDLFGKLRSLNTVQMEAYLATEDTAKAAQIALIGEIADAWLTLAADSNQLSLARATQANAQKTLDITLKRLELGVDSRIDLASAETVFYGANSDIAVYTTQVSQDLNALRLLVGEQLDSSLLPDSLPDAAELVADVPAGLSSSVLLQRPDVLAAEHQLKSANANIGAARAAFFPSLSLTATGGLASAVLADIFTGGASSIWTIAPSLTLPIFDGGANEANLAYSQAQQTKYLASYEYAIQNAFAEVADALARRATIQAQLNAEQALVIAATRSYELSLARYKGGVDSFQNALTAQRILYQAQQSLILTKQVDLANRISLYRVLGGGITENGAI
ncbi:efflux transporter outer membrane subunit [Paraglaciecola sp. L3A3]|uniref:efflux transporter outer membrane subunit n=1 Tax=Paraglaciecola sp. L3A3 TaxID=2686358 RepID=UPI00131E505C|nr:efflux transporter outer membrane subunit [Paraglaciecola sp. L3A3]